MFLFKKIICCLYFIKYFYFQAISLPYVYQEPNFIKIGQRPSTLDTIYEVRNPVVPVLETQEISLSPFSLICSIVTVRKHENILFSSNTTFFFIYLEDV